MLTNEIMYQTYQDVDSHFPISSGKVKVLLGDDVISFFYFLRKEDFIEREPPQLQQDHSPIPICISQNFVSNRYGNESSKKSRRSLHSSKCFSNNVAANQLEKMSGTVYNIFITNYK